MLSGYGWCVLRASRDAYSIATIDDVRSIDAQVDAADKLFWSEFRTWMAARETPWLLWHFYEYHNNASGTLLFFISRNHRASPVWDMLQWIAANGHGSYGIFYAHDDEDVIDSSTRGREIVEDYDNVFRVHRILNGSVTELADPFFGSIIPNIDPPHPYDGDDETVDE
jgi:hypothetical protein